MHRKWLILNLLLIAGGLLWLYTSVPWIHWSGGYDLTIHVKADPGLVDSIACESFLRREDAEGAFGCRFASAFARCPAKADPFVGQPLTIYINQGGQDAMSGRELSRTQYRFIVVFGLLHTGGQVSKVVEIPDGRVSREISVELP